MDNSQALLQQEVTLGQNFFWKLKWYRGYYNSHFFQFMKRKLKKHLLKYSSLTKNMCAELNRSAFSSNFEEIVNICNYLHIASMSSADMRS